MSYALVTRLLVVPAIALPLILSACSDESGEGGELNVTLREWAVEPGVSSLESGDIIFNTNNEGPEHEHELVIIRTDIAVGELPTKEDGSVDEKADGVDVVGEVAEVEAGKKGSGTFTLDPGKYALICNIVDEHEGEEMAHYQKGMFAAFTAE